MPEKMNLKWHKTRGKSQLALSGAVFCSKSTRTLSNHKLARSQGFTLIEMLMTLAIVAILVSLAVPRYEQFMAQQDVNRVTQQMRDHLSLARTYAQTHQTLVQLCPVEGVHVNDEIPSCSTMTTWNAWMVAEVDDRGSVQQVIARSPPTLGAVQVASGSRSYFELNRQGGADGSNGTVTITSTQMSTIDARLKVAPNGRIRECKTNASCQ